MRFKMSSKNPFRNFVRNLRRITISDLTNEEKSILNHDLLLELSPKLLENERYLNYSPAFSSRCEHWNYLENNIKSIKPITNIKNPYLQLKYEFIEAININSYSDCVRSVSKSLMWFYNNPYKEDWVT